MIGFEPGFEARVVADDVRLTFPDYLLKAALDASYAAKDHTHTVGQITGLQGALDGKFPTTGGRVTGEFGATTTVAVYGDGNAHVWFRKNDGTEKGVIWAESSTGNINLRTSGVTYQFQPNGQFWAAGDLVARGHVYAGSGTAYLNSGDGNVYGPRWTTWGSYWAFDAINARIEQRINDVVGYANDRAYWRTQEYMLAEHVPVGGYAFLNAETGANAGTILGGGSVHWASAGGGTTSAGDRVNYGTWRACGAFTGQNGTAGNLQPRTATVFQRIG